MNATELAQLAVGALLGRIAKTELRRHALSLGNPGTRNSATAIQIVPAQRRTVFQARPVVARGTGVVLSQGNLR